MREKYEDDFEAGMGAEAVKKLLADIDLAELSVSSDARAWRAPPARRRSGWSSAWKWWTPSANPATVRNG